MSRIIDPPLRDLGKLRQPLTKGEKMFLRLLDDKLPPEWEIYIQPAMNGLRPDFVVFNPDVGAVVYEVKDWDMDAMRYFRSGEKLSLVAKKDGKTFSKSKDDPLPKVYLYWEELRKLYSPSSSGDDGMLFACGIVFPFASRTQLASLFGCLTKKNEKDKTKSVLISKEYFVADGDPRSILPLFDKPPRVVNKQAAEELRYWLVEPEISKEQRTPIVLDAKQKALVETRTVSGFRRISGPAGSGKSLVLAAKAAKLGAEGRRVLCMTYNITMTHYLRDQTARFAAANLGADMRSVLGNVTFIHYHAWCKRVCYMLERMDEYHGLFKDENVFSEGLPRLVIDALMAAGGDIPEELLCDAILVDEGQDFYPLWWESLRMILKSGGEMVLVADKTQDIYGVSRAWTERAMNGAGFTGAWSDLGTSYRIPDALVPFVAEFANRYMDDRLVDVPNASGTQGDFFFNMRWFQVAGGKDVLAAVAVERIANAVREIANPSAYADIVFLADSGEVGLKMARMLEKKNIKTRHVFSEKTGSGDARSMKMKFWMGSEMVKGATIHSFKGWEASNLFIVFDDASSASNLPALVYTAITRCKHSERGSNLTVVCANERFREYGRTWPEYREINGERGDE